LIVTTPLEGVGAGAGVGAGVGAIGLPPESVELPQPHAPRLNTTIILATNTRMSFLVSNLVVTELDEIELLAFGGKATASSLFA
jgi:hypothetical protein